MISFYLDNHTRTMLYVPTAQFLVAFDPQKTHAHDSSCVKPRRPSCTRGGSCLNSAGNRRYFTLLTASRSPSRSSLSAASS